MKKEECKIGLPVFYGDRPCIITNFHFNKDETGSIELSPRKGHFFWVDPSDVVIMKFIKAPFSEDQVAALNKYQQLGIVHEFTCMSFNGCERKKNNDGILIATTEGWICPCGKYTQDWAHSFMADPN